MPAFAPAIASHVVQPLLKLDTPPVPVHGTQPPPPEPLQPLPSGHTEDCVAVTDGVLESVAEVEGDLDPVAVMLAAIVLLE